MAWVKAHVSELMAIAERLGAGRVSLCGSVARGTDTESSDIDFYVWEFDEGASGTIEHSEARQRAQNLVNEFVRCRHITLTSSAFLAGCWVHPMRRVCNGIRLISLAWSSSPDKR
jgi:predicted nucleotidyltransferase